MLRRGPSGQPMSSAYYQVPEVWFAALRRNWAHFLCPNGTALTNGVILESMR